MKPISYCEVKRKLEAAGFNQVSQKGSHIKFLKETDAGRLTTIVPFRPALQPLRCLAFDRQNYRVGLQDNPLRFF